MDVLFRSPLGALLAKPWVYQAGLFGLKRWYFPLSRLWAAANAAGGDAARFRDEIGAPVAALSGRLAAQQGRPGTSALATLSTLRVIEVKRLSQELADRWGAALTTVFVVLGLFSIATGTMLVVLIFVMLAAERRTELGVLRALGARRGRVAAILLYEGLFYDLVAAAIGVLVGIGVAVIF